MSLRLQITALFGAILVLTMVVAAYLGGSMAARAVEEGVRERSVEVARSMLAELDLGREVREADRARVAGQLAAAIGRHRGVRLAELALRRPGPDDIVRVTFGRSGPETTFEQRDFLFSAKPAARLLGEGDARVAQADLPVNDPFARAVANLRVEAYVSDAEAIAARERSVFLWVTVVSALVLAAAFTVILGRMLARPLSQLAAAMALVETSAGGPPAAIPGAERRDEIGTVARGLDAMLARIRGFSRELQERIDAATADLARKNRDLVELNDLLVEARRDLTAKEQLAALGQLSGTIAHELGNPLNAISGHVQLLARDPACPLPMKEQLEVIEREVKRMTSIIRRFLDSARALTPAPEPVEVAALVDEALSLTVSAEARHRLEVRREVPAEMGQATLDPSLVRHVLTNFISNAMDAMPQGGRLVVSARRAGDDLALTVKDSGPGIGPEERGHVFEPFYSTKPRGKGTGLGLAICREIAAALKGRIELETAPGQGAAFTLFVPAPAPRAEAGAAGRARGG